MPAIVLIKPASEVWPALRNIVLQLPRTQIVLETDDYIHAECTSAIFGFVDDLEFHLRSEDNLIAVRSASRLGSSDLGVNLKRIENIRNKLIQQNFSAPTE